MATYTDKDPGFKLDVFGKASITSADQTLINNLMTTLLAKPGNFPSQPDLGMDITKYLMSTESTFNANVIKATLAAQCSDFAEVVKDGTFDIQLLPNSKTGQEFILISLPVKTETNKQWFVTVEVSLDNEQIFNFVFGDSTDVYQYL